MDRAAQIHYETQKDRQCILSHVEMLDWNLWICLLKVECS